jgi:hypothetical protein
VQAGVPLAADDDDPPPPQPAITSKASTNIGVHAKCRFLPGSSKPEAANAIVHINNHEEGGTSPSGLRPVLLAAVVVTVAVTVVAEVPEHCKSEPESPLVSHYSSD